MFPLHPNEFWLYYAGFSLLALLIFLRRPRRGMRLRFGGRGSSSSGSSSSTGQRVPLGAARPLMSVETGGGGEERFLNVGFNYNGHAWDAYEVLGLPAGSSLEKVQAALRESMAKVEPDSRAFLDAAYQAIQSQRRVRKG